MNVIQELLVNGMSPGIAVNGVHLFCEKEMGYAEVSDNGSHRAKDYGSEGLTENHGCHNEELFPGLSRVDLLSNKYEDPRKDRIHILSKEISFELFRRRLIVSDQGSLKS